MLEQISQLVKQYGREAVIENPDIPNEENNAVLAEATSTITGGMQNMLAGGGFARYYFDVYRQKPEPERSKWRYRGIIKKPNGCNDDRSSD